MEADRGLGVAKAHRFWVLAPLDCAPQVTLVADHLQHAHLIGDICAGRRQGVRDEDGLSGIWWRIWCCHSCDDGACTHSRMN